MKGDERAVGWVYAASVYVLVAVIVVYAVAVFFFVPRQTDIDDLGLFNPIYMQIHYHQMSYPAYGPGFYFHSMFVHPPTRYFEIANVMRLGMALPYAQELSVFLLTIALAVIIATSRFSGLPKLALLFGFFAGLVWTAQTDGATYTLRPDTEVALCWFLGLVLLQDGMLRGWNLPRLFFGSLALTYASGLHYYAVLSFVGVFYYATKAWGELPKQSFRNVILVMGAGCCLFGIPYLALFVIPHAQQILRISGAVQSAGGWFGPILRHFDEYALWLNAYTLQGVRALFYLLYVPLWLKAPLFVMGSILLAMRRETRGIAIASLPLTAFVFAISHGKSAGYYLPELIIYFSGIGALAGQILQVLASKIPFGRREVLVPLLLAGAACWVTRIGQPVYKDAQISLKPLQSTMDVARACAKRLVGPDAFIAGRIGLWYISGAAKWYDVSIDLLWQKHISSIDLPKYFSQFDDVVEHNQGSDVSVNAQGEALASWYVSGLLKLHGFFLDSSPQTNPANSVSFLVFRTKPSPLEGYLLKFGHAYHFEENREGNNVFIARLCRLEGLTPDYSNLPNFDAIYLPKQAHEDFQRVLIVSVMTKDEFATQRRRLDSQCALLSTRRGNLRQLALDNLMAQAAKQERPILFYQDPSDAIVPTLHTIRIPTPPFDLQHLRLAYDAAKITGEQTKTVTTARAPWSWAALLDIPKNLPSRSWIAIRLRVITGEVSFDVWDPRTNTVLTRRFVVRADGPQEIYLAVSSSASPRQLIIQNGDASGSSKVVLESIGLISEQRSASMSEAQRVGARR